MPLKNLATKFTPQAKLVLTNGKAYHKSLLATSAAARVYIESLGRLGHDARTNGKGGTEEIGQAIFRVAEIYKEIQMKFEDCVKSAIKKMQYRDFPVPGRIPGVYTAQGKRNIEQRAQNIIKTKALFAEIILPLEQKLENEFKNAVAEQRKYHQGHKEFLAPYTKAVNCLEKFNKKNQSKGVYDEAKEAPYSRAVFKYQEKLDEFRTQGLKLALLEERKCYCFILSHLTTVAGVQLKYHDRGLECLTDEIATWRQMSSQPHVLPPSADAFLSVVDPRRSLNNGGMSMTYGYSGSLSIPYNQAGSQGEYMTGRPPSEYNLPTQPSPGQMVHTPRTMLPPLPVQGLQVKALYAHVASNESQLKFNPGEMLTLVGEPADGWNYAYNPVNNEYGWVPLAFVESAPRTNHHNGPLTRAKSISDLKEQSLAALSSPFVVGTRSPYNHSSEQNRRPATTQDPAMVKMISDNFQTPGSETGSLNSSSSLNTHNTHAPIQWPGIDIYQSVPGEINDMHNHGHGMVSSGTLFSADGQSFHTARSHSYSRPPSPPLPPPPMPANFSSPPPVVGGSATVPNTPLTSSRPRSNSIGTYLPHAPQTPSFSIPPPPKFEAPLPPATSASTAQTPSSGRAVPPPVSQKTTSLSSVTPHQTASLSNHVPPPAPPPPPAPTVAKNPFSGVSLKKTKTDDRSAPRI